MQPVAMALVTPVGPPLAQSLLAAGTSTTAVLGVLASPWPPFKAVVLIVGPNPSSPESNRPLPSASGKPIPLPLLQGALHAVMVWNRTVVGLSSLMNVR